MHDKNTRLYYWVPSENWPPKSVQEPGEIRTDGRLSVSCTQTSRSANDQRKLVARWCETLPNLRGVRHLWLCSRVPQRLFDAACQVPGLESLYIKWGGIKKFVIGHCGTISLCYPARATLALAISSRARSAWVWRSVNSNPPTALRRSSQALWAKPLAQPRVYPEASLCLSRD
jgi:hypothetical protein